MGHPIELAEPRTRKDVFLRHASCVAGVAPSLTRIIATLGHEKVQFDMDVQEQIKKYIASQPGQKRSDMQELHRLVLRVLPACKLWFLDGKNSDNKTVSNPNIGYGCHTIKYVDGAVRDFYRIGLSANKTGISIYIMGIKDKTYLAKTYGEKIGNAGVTGYCIKFKTLKNINVDILEAALRSGDDHVA
jgi:Domain of unknown function (DU1801)